MVTKFVQQFSIDMVFSVLSEIEKHSQMREKSKSETWTVQ